MVKIHKSSEVFSNRIGINTTVWQFCVILEKAEIGNDCNICSHVFIENDVKIGNKVTVKASVQLWDGITIEDEVFIGPNATFTNDLFPRSKQYPTSYEKTLIKKGASIGANATIVAGIVIGEYSLIGAGSVVTKDVAPFSVFYGNPAKQHGYITKEGIMLNMELQSKEGIQYFFENGQLKDL
jgi:UDP-2-acetamido-3-amino-2,3-dideoxy-glucuronate N-acetyltransferase